MQTASSVINCELNGGTVTSGGYNLSDDATCGFSATGDIQSSSNVSLGALADNGGPTQTMQPDTSSAGIDAADCSVAASTDQRGASRASSGATCDIGAVEVDGLVPVKLITAYNDTGPIAEGASATINAVATGPAGISYDYSFDCDTNGDYEDSDNGTGTSGTGTCTLETDGIFHVDIEVCDAADSSNCDTGLASVTVTNVAPVVSSPTVTPSSTTQSARTLTGAMDNTPSASDEGTSVVASATFYDPGIPDIHTCTVDYGDGTGPQPVPRHPPQRSRPEHRPTAAASPSPADRVNPRRCRCGWKPGSGSQSLTGLHFTPLNHVWNLEAVR